MRAHRKTFGPAIRTNFQRFDILHGIEDGKQPEWHRMDLIYEGRKREWLEKQAKLKFEAELDALLDKLG